MTVTYGDLTLDWLGYATVRVEGGDGTVVYLDPGRYGVLEECDPRDGDLVCVSHDDHYDPDGIERVAAPDATVVVCDAVDAREIDRDVRPVDDLPFDVVRVGQHDDRVLVDVVVRTVPAYNRLDGHVDADGEPYHPEGRGVGYHLTVGDVGVFWPGDSDVLDGHERLDVDAFLPPIGGSFTMDRHEAADLAAALGPDLVVPVHYDTFEALEADAAAFAADVAARGVPVALDE